MLLIVSWVTIILPALFVRKVHVFGYIDQVTCLCSCAPSFGLCLGFSPLASVDSLITFFVECVICVCVCTDCSHCVCYRCTSKDL